MDRAPEVGRQHHFHSGSLLPPTTPWNAVASGLRQPMVLSLDHAGHSYRQMRPRMLAGDIVFAGVKEEHRAELSLVHVKAMSEVVAHTQYWELESRSCTLLGDATTIVVVGSEEGLDIHVSSYLECPADHRLQEITRHGQSLYGQTDEKVHLVAESDGNRALRER